MATAGNFDKDNSDTIFNQDYNTIRNKINNVLGIGSGTSGYGATVASTTVDQYENITLDQWQTLRSEINQCYKHVSGSNSPLGIINSTTKITAPFVNLMNTSADFIVTNKDSVAAGQTTLTTGLSAERNTPWNGAIARVCTVTWSSEDNIRNFFNAGGNISIALSRGSVGTGVSQGKNTDWAVIIDANPTLSFTQSNYRNATANVQIRSAVTGTQYTSNYLRAWGHKITNTSVRITVLFDDATLAASTGVGTGWIDEPVDMRITTSVNYYSSTDAVTSPTPDATNQWTDLGFVEIRTDPANISVPSGPSPTYTITPNASSVNEGSSITFTIGGTNIVNGTYYWTVTNSGDFGTSNGSFVINNNAGTFSVTPTADSTTEGAESFTASLRSGSASGPILATSTAVTINDTSQAVAPPVTPTYTFAQVGDINEGSSFTYRVNTTNVPNGTTLYWTITHGSTSSADFSSSQGNFNINNNTGTFSVSASADGLTEGAQTFTMTVRTGSNSGTIVLTSGTLTVNDTSQDVTYNYDPEWLDEFAASYGYNTSGQRSSFRNRGQNIANNQYLSNNLFVSVTPPRYGLYRKPDAAGLAFWTDYALDNGFTATSSGFVQAFFGAITSGNDFNRSNTQQTVFDNGSGDGDFYDRSIAG